MYRSHRIATTPIQLRGGHEVSISGEVVDITRTPEETIARARLPDYPRDIVFCWTDLTGRLAWAGGFRAESATPTVLTAEDAVINPAGCRIEVGSPIEHIEELDPHQYAICWRPRASDVRNVVCFGQECELLWRIGNAPGKPPWAYNEIALPQADRLEAYVKGWGYFVVVNQQTGAIESIGPYK